MTTRTFSSEAIKEASYDYATERLDLVFHDGTRYRGYQVPSTKWRAMLRSPSAGRYFNTSLKGSVRLRKLPS